MLRDEREGREQERVFHYEGGIREFVKFLNKNREVLFPEPIYIEGVKNGVSVEAALQYNDSYAENVLHLRQQHPHARRRHAPDGLPQAALTRVINDYGRNKCRPPVLKDSDAQPQGRGCARRPDGHRVGQAAWSRSLRGRPSPSWATARCAPSWMRWWPRGCPPIWRKTPPWRAVILDRCLQRRPRARGRPQGARPDPPQDRAGIRLPARQAGRLLRARSRQVRNLYRRGRLGRRQRQDGARPPLSRPSCPCAARS